MIVAFYFLIEVTIVDELSLCEDRFLLICQKYYTLFNNNWLSKIKIMDIKTEHSKGYHNVFWVPNGYVEFLHFVILSLTLCTMPS